MSEPEEQPINPRTGKPGGPVNGGSQGAWDPEKISRDIEAARRKQNPEPDAQEKRWGIGLYDPEQIARDIEAARQKQNPEEPLPKNRVQSWGEATHLCERANYWRTARRKVAEMSTNKGLLPNLGKLLWAKIEELAEPTQAEKARQQPSGRAQIDERTKEDEGRSYCEDAFDRGWRGW
jgi:hypothetical protein